MAKAGQSIHAVMAALVRRAVLRGFGAVTLVAAAPRAAMAAGSTLAFAEVTHGLDDKHHVAAGYDAQVLIRWGDPVLRDAPPFDAANLSADTQARQFGYNNDFIGYVPLPVGSNSSSHGLLGINHEYCSSELMFPAYDGPDPGGWALRKAEIEMAAHGFSVIEVKRERERWTVVDNSRYRRRITAETPIRISGPAAGHRRLKTAGDPAGGTVRGTLSNCSGGMTPWGTFLSAEESPEDYFRGDAANSPDAKLLARYGIGSKSLFDWGIARTRFRLADAPNEPNRFGWVVEIDPYEPLGMPTKRTGLGRFKHEAATVVIAPDGRVVVYMGDDGRNEYVYRFVSDGRFDPRQRDANQRLLDEGTLSVARFDADGSMTWLPLVAGKGPLTASAGFADQGEVLVNTRGAADLLGATRMDRPEDIETNPVTGRVYVVCTGMTRAADAVNPANPRSPGTYGHVIELVPPGEGAKSDHTAMRYRWDFFALGGDPSDAKDAARFHPATSGHGWLVSPDNCTFDSRGRIWIASDGLNGRKKLADGLFAADTLGPGRALFRHFFRAPAGAEVCGPCFTPDNQTLFLSIQHPGEGSKHDKPSTRWPDFKADVPPRPSVLAITKQGGGTIGS
jgi:uncharacterized protein